MSTKIKVRSVSSRRESNNSSTPRNKFLTPTSRKSTSNVTPTSRKSTSNVTPTSRKSRLLLKSNVLQTKKNNINALKSIDAQCKKIIKMVDFHIYFFKIMLKNKKYMKANKRFIEYLKSINDIIISKFNAEDCSRLSFAVLLFYYFYEINIYNIQNNEDNLKKIIDAFTENSLLSRNSTENKYSYFLTIFYKTGDLKKKIYTRFIYEDSNLYYLLYEYYKIYTIHEYDIEKFVSYLFIAGFNGQKAVTNWIEPLLIILRKYKAGEISAEYIIKAMEFPTLYESIKDIESFSNAFGNLRGGRPEVSLGIKAFWKYYISENISIYREDRPNIIQLINNLFDYINSKIAETLQINANNKQVETLKLKANITVKYSNIKAELIKHLLECILITNLDIIEELTANITNEELKGLLIKKIAETKSKLQSNNENKNSVGVICKATEFVYNCKINGVDTGPLCPESLEDYKINKADCV